MTNISVVEQARAYLEKLNRILDQIDLKVFKQVVDHFLMAYHNGSRIFTMGNGGSAATASHLACDINKGCCLGLEKKFRLICLSDNVPTLMAVANDLAYEEIFRVPLQNFFIPGDLVVGISGSGNSENVLRAISWAKENGGLTIGMSGFGGGKLAELTDISLVVASNDMQKVEDVHLIIGHMLMQALYRELNPDSRMGACG